MQFCTGAVSFPSHTRSTFSPTTTRGRGTRGDARDSSVVKHAQTSSRYWSSQGGGANDRENEEEKHLQTILANNRKWVTETVIEDPDYFKVFNPKVSQFNPKL